MTFVSIANSQNEADMLVKCITTNKYLKSSSTSDGQTIYSPASLCYNEHYFVFYTKETGEVGFKIQQPVFPQSQETEGELKGYLYTTYISEESATTPIGYYSAQIYIGEKKIAVITYTRRDVTYIIQAANFVGSSENIQISKTLTSPLAKINSPSTLTKSNGEVKNNSGFSFNLVNRELIIVPSAFDTMGNTGKVVVDIIVDKSGNVVDAIPGSRGSTTTLIHLFKLAKEAALKSKFSANPKLEQQKGTMSFIFKPK